MIWKEDTCLSHEKDGLWEVLRFCHGVFFICAGISWLTLSNLWSVHKVKKANWPPWCWAYWHPGESTPNQQAINLKCLICNNIIERENERGIFSFQRYIWVMDYLGFKDTILKIQYLICDMDHNSAKMWR